MERTFFAFVPLLPVPFSSADTAIAYPESNAKNVEGAEKFINFVSDKESALRIADEIGYTTPNKEARLEQPDSVINNPNAYMPKEIMDRCEIYVDFPKNIKRMYDDAWLDIKSSN